MSTVVSSKYFTVIGDGIFLKDSQLDLWVIKQA